MPLKFAIISEVLCLLNLFEFPHFDATICKLIQMIKEKDIISSFVN